jgi:hypothetical protein
MTSKQEHVDTAQTHLVRSLKLAEESKQIGVNTLTKLDEQTEQLRRVRGDAEDTEHIIKGNRGVVKDMRRNWIVRLCCYGRSDMLPGPVTWDNRDSPEEQLRVKKMIKLEKRRRMLRRKGKSSGTDPSKPGEGASSSQSSWRFWRRNSGNNDSDNFSDLSDVSDLSDDPAEFAQPAHPILPTNKVHVPMVQIDENIDETTALDQLSTTVQDLKVIALQISETSKFHQGMIEGVTKQVNTNQVELDRNQELVGKLGRRAKDDGDSGMLSASDRLAILGVKTAISSRMQ